MICKKKAIQSEIEDRRLKEFAGIVTNLMI
jgi:hypothetical protein